MYNAGVFMFKPYPKVVESSTTWIKQFKRPVNARFLSVSSYRISNLLEGVFGAASSTAQNGASLGAAKCDVVLFDGLARFLNSTY